jgi:hypothetical protein
MAAPARSAKEESVMKKLFILAVAGLTTAYAQHASAGATSESKTVFTRSDGKVCTTITRAAKNDFGDVRRASSTSCRDHRPPAQATTERKIITTSDGRICTVLTRWVTNDLGDSRRVSSTSCRQRPMFLSF